MRDAATNYFCTENLKKDLKGRAIRGGAVTGTAQAAKFLLRLSSTIVLARLVAPEAFGLVAMVTVVTGFVALFKDAGLSMATIQRENITHDQVSTLFWINVGLSLGVVAVVALLAPIVAWFYGEPRLIGITLVLAGTFLFGGLTVQHQALLRRRMRFKQLGVADVSSQVAGVAVAVVMASLGYGYWSLVGMTLAEVVTNCCLVWIMCGWRPGRPARGSGVRPMLKMGGFLTGFNTINYFARNLDNLLIGWCWGSAALGIYSRAYALLLQPVRQINAPISAVVAPAMSRLNSDPDRFRSVALKLFRILAVLTAPFVVVVVVFADQVVLLLLGEQWMQAVDIFRWLALVSLIQIALNQQGNIFIACDRSDLLFRVGVLNSFVSCLSFLAGLAWGGVGVAAAYSVTGLFIRCPVSIYYLARTGRFTQRELYLAVAPSIGLCLLVVAAGLILVELLGERAYQLELLWVLGGVLIVYIMAYVSVPHFKRTLTDAVELVRHLRPASATRVPK